MRIQYLWSILLVVYLASLLCRLLLVLVFVLLAVCHFSLLMKILCVCVFYCSCWKSIDLINLGNACEYFATKSLLLVGQVPPLVVISCFSVLLCLSSILQLYIKWFDDWAPSLYGHIGLSIILNLWRYDFVFPMSRYDSCELRRNWLESLWHLQVMGLSNNPTCSGTEEETSVQSNLGSRKPRIMNNSVYEQIFRTQSVSDDYSVSSYEHASRQQRGAISWQYQRRQYS